MLWVLNNYKHLVADTVLVAVNEVENVITKNKPGTVIRSSVEAYSLASKFKGVLYRHPYLKKRHARIMMSIIDRCGEAYVTKDLDKLYISRETLEEWVRVFSINANNLENYLYPLQLFGIIERSDRPEYVYRVTNGFFSLVGPVSRHLIVPVHTSEFINTMSVVSGLASLYAIGYGIKRGVSKPVVPWFLKLAMIYTLSGLNPSTMKVDAVLSASRVNAVDNYFVIELGFPVELWRCIRTEAFEYMVDAKVIEGTANSGYRLSDLWVRVHEEGVRRYVTRVRERMYKR